MAADAGPRRDLTTDFADYHGRRAMVGGGGRRGRRIVCAIAGFALFRFASRASLQAVMVLAEMDLWLDAR